MRATGLFKDGIMNGLNPPVIIEDEIPAPPVRDDDPVPLDPLDNPWTVYRCVSTNEFFFQVELEKMSKNPKLHQKLMGMFEVPFETCPRLIRRALTRKRVKMKARLGL